MTPLAIAVALTFPPLMLFAFVVGERFERDRWIEAIQRKAQGADSNEEYALEMLRLWARVRKDGWTDAP